MQTIDNTNVETVRTMTNAEMRVAIVDLMNRVAILESAKSTSTSKSSEKEMTEADAEAVTYGDLSEMKHKNAAEQLGLTYGQVYSARLEFTFKNVHKSAKEAGKTNKFKK